MLAHLIRKELRDLMTGSRFIVLAALSICVIGWGLIDGMSFYLETLDTHQSALRAKTDRIQSIIQRPPKYFGSWGEFYIYGFRIHKPPVALSIFARGLEPVLGRSFWAVVAPHDRKLIRSPATEEPVLATFESLDLGSVAPTVLALFILLLTYSAFCGEKEAGTLRLVSSFPVPRSTLLVAKLLTSALAVLITFAIPLILGIAFLVLHPRIAFSGAEWSRLAVILLSFGVFAATMAAAGLLFSSLTRRGTTAFVLLLAFWTGAVVILPRLSLIASDALVGAPSETQLNRDLEVARSLIGRKVAEQRGLWIKNYTEEHGKPWNASAEGREAYYMMLGSTRAASLSERISKNETVFNGYDNQQDSWLAFGRRLASISPAFVLSRSTSRLAGTGLERQRRFRDAAVRYMERLTAWTISTQMEDQLSRMGRHEIHGEFEWEVDHLPRFTYQEVWPDEDLARAVFDIGLIALWGILFTAAAFVAVLRYDVR